MANPEQLAEWRDEFQLLHDMIMNERDQFRARFEEAALIKLKTDEMRECAAEIKKDQQRYWQLIAQLPKVEEFSPDELEKRTGKAAEHLRLAEEIILMNLYLSRRIEKLHFLSRHPSQ